MAWLLFIVLKCGGLLSISWWWLVLVIFAEEVLESWVRTLES